MELIFVYNANSSVFSQVTDYVHKLLRPQTYQCNLCKLTYDNLGMKSDWKEFIQNLPYKSEFLHKDEFIDKYPEYINSSFPSIFKRENKGLIELISAKEINKQKSVKELKQLVLQKLK